MKLENLISTKSFKDTANHYILIIGYKGQIDYDVWCNKIMSYER